VAKQFQQVKCGCKLNEAELLDTATLDQDDRATVMRNLTSQVDLDLLDQPELKWFVDKLNPIAEWKMLTLNEAPPGLLIVCNMFKQNYLSELYQSLMFELPRKHAEVLKSNESLAQLRYATDDELIRSNLRWVTFGYHYDWTEKVKRNRKVCVAIINHKNICRSNRFIDLRIRALFRKCCPNCLTV
jgi:hypothetical protein